MYIVPNDKPVNKYSLIIAGSCPILEPDMDTINPLHSYGIRAHTEEKCHIMLKVKDEYSEEILQEYVQRNLKRITNMISTVDEKIALYEQAVEAFKSPEGKIAFYGWMKYYYENHYCNGTATPEYKSILKDLVQINSEQKLSSVVLII